MLDEHLQIVLGVTAAIVGIYSYVPYLRDMFAGKTKPHAFSWLIWGLLMIIGWAGQVSDDGGPGAWTTGISGLITLWIFLLSFRYGEKEITRSDWVCLIFCLLAIPLWFFTTAVAAMVLISVIDVAGYLPTFRKTYFRPFEETASLYWMTALRTALGIIALKNFSPTTLIYPVSLLVPSLAMVGLIAWRRIVYTPRLKKS